jgi:hypothetical protein
MYRGFFALAIGILPACDDPGAETGGAANAPVAPSMERRVRLVAATTTLRVGNEGLDVMNDDCDAAFAGSRMCTDMEVYHQLPGGNPGADAWVMFTVSAAVTGSQQGGFFDPIGLPLAANQLPNCINSSTVHPFATTSGNTVILTTAGTFGVKDCSSSAVVACCM